jgi:hypothetical protein
MKTRTTSERIESLRKERVKSAETKVVKLLRYLNTKQISITHNLIWDSFRNTLINDCELLEQTLEDYIREILLEYDKGSQIAKKIIFDLVKDPLRQNISEEVQEQIANEKGFKIEKLPQSGKNCLRIYQGKVVRSSELTKKEKELSSKSLDFKLINEKKPNLKFFTYNKYNKWVGGSTDDVFNDVRHLIENFENAKDKSIVLVIILDGYYWDLNRRKLQSYQNENLIITSSDELTILNETPELH